MPFGSRKSFGDASTLKAVRGATVTKTSITIAIALSGIALGTFHYELKPKPTEQDLQNVAQGMASRIMWRGQIAPDIEVKTTRGDTFRLSDPIGSNSFGWQWVAP